MLVVLKVGMPIREIKPSQTSRMESSSSSLVQKKETTTVTGVKNVSSISKTIF
jgi:hypothetical protein